MNGLTDLTFSIGKETSSILLFSRMPYTKMNSQIKSQSKSTHKDIEFVSASNDMAFITLSILARNRFELYMEILPVAKSGNKIETLRFEGNWFVDNGRYYLTFEEYKPYLELLFIGGYGFPEKIIVEDEAQISFSIDAEQIPIWGIACGRLEMEQPTAER